MRVVFVFPPRASATYVPLGIASLASYIEAAVPGVSVRLLDLNLAAWIHLANQDIPGRDLTAFVRGNRGTFTDPGQTLHFKSVWDRLRQQVTLLGRQAETFLAQGEIPPDLHDLLASQCHAILADDPDLVAFPCSFRNRCRLPQPW